MAVGDAFINGIVKNVARPEGNITGVTNQYALMGGKCRISSDRTHPISWDGYQLIS
jgi:hypothetical protein